MNLLSFPGSRQEQLNWLSRIKGSSYVDAIGHFNDEELQKLFRLVYLEFLKLEEAADELML
ncbi:hypothetical protein [Paenibacillus radicis (ex Xue et al. 2023)]|uniref:Uncharacterized protein n=1 Tax=Paenibacillus radicis (ex Xue et al. 2023) TaxID=2972489 RepID=A0ABT1YR72_9BACL|nr:hypothetical protein [Paenibacillus radicis (ex Xue et al. 2023)]MCR8635681.1 hypothetical protein [Paenibacillus radicis (ex Xue et al. 2023)]